MFREHEKLDSRQINFVPRDIVIAGSGWTHARSSGADGKGPSNFATMCGEQQNTWPARDSRSSKIKCRLDSEAVQGEIIVETACRRKIYFR